MNGTYYDEGCQAFLNGEVHHNNPYNPDEEATEFNCWNNGYDAMQELYTPNLQLGIR